jgi:hypothetical protein
MATEQELLHKAKYAEERAAKAKSREIREVWQTVAENYREVARFARTSKR